MKKMLLSLFVIFLLSSFSTFGQVTNLIFCGQTSNFNKASGDTVSWSYDVPNPGDTTLIEIWIDADNSGTINTGDVLWIFFNQIDGDTLGHNGPPDLDGQANSKVFFKQVIGLAPGNYVIVFKNHGAYTTRAGTITALVSPTFTISGHVTVPNGNSAKNIVINIQNMSHKKDMFWTALTDANGDYTIKMNSDTSGNPWWVKVDNRIIFGSSVTSPEGISLTIDAGVKTSYTGNNFTITSAAASINGTVKDENGNPIINGNAFINASNGGNLNRAKTDTAGVFHLGLLANELPAKNVTLTSGDSYDTTIVVPYFTFVSVNSNDNLTHDLIIFKANSTITGRITVNGSSPNSNINVYAQSTDTALGSTQTDLNGYYRVKVSTKIYNYTMALGNFPTGYTFNSPIAHAGDVNVNINLIPTDVKLIDSNIPADYSLSQNYPNPFNPGTIINYDIPKASHVTLTVYNMLGQEITKLVNKELAAGRYSVDFNPASAGGGLASGIYLYKIQAGNFVSFKKMILMK